MGTPTQVRLVPYEDSIALVLDKEMLDELNINEETQLQAVTDGHSLTITPVRDETRRKQIQGILEELDQEYGPVFKRLAE
jgi:antitoxin component of MazEF toxin-antitoxin module